MGQRGFTLLEVMLSIAILGIFLMVAAPKLGGSKNDFKLYTTARNCVSDIRYAQELSIDTKDRHGIFFTPNGYEIRDIDSPETKKTVNFSNGTVYEKIQDESENVLENAIVFDSEGRPYEYDGYSTTAITERATIFLKASNIYIYIKVTPSTGEVSFGWNL